MDQSIAKLNYILQYTKILKYIFQYITIFSKVSKLKKLTLLFLLVRTIDSSSTRNVFADLTSICLTHLLSQ